MKKFISVLVVFAMLITLAPISVFAADNSMKFSDVKDTDYYAQAAKSLAESGILAGYPDGTFGAERNVTRAEMAAVVCRMIGKDAEVEAAKGKTIFDDVANDHWATGYINIASELGIISGDGNGKFRPEDDVKYEEAIKMVVCAFGYGDNVEVNPEDWSAEFLKIAEEKDITIGLKGEKGKAITRGDVAVVSYNGIDAAVKDGIIKQDTKTEETKPVTQTSFGGGGGGGGGGGSSTPVKYSLTFADVENGSVNTSVAGSYAQNSTINLVATPNENYVFVKWESDNGGTFTDANSATTTFTMPAKNVVITAIFAEKEAVSEEIADLFGVDPDDYDTDEDGLSNYIEIYIVGTDPTIKDSDDNGVDDGNEDADNDGLTNLEEIALGTSLVKEDTDNDGLSDYIEVNTHNTDPLNYDTDVDTLGDGDEILLGLNPLVQKTDGVTLDSERTFTQELSEDNIDEELMSEDNAAVPSLTLMASGNINNDVLVETTSSNDFSDSRAIVGEAIDISGENISEGVLTFTLKDEGVSLFALEDEGKTFNTNLICKYNADGSTEYLDTDYDAEKKTISAEINGEGTYFVLDVKSLFNELGLTLPEVSDIYSLEDEPSIGLMSISDDEHNNSNNNTNGEASSEISLFAIDEEDIEIASADTKKVTLMAASGGAMAQADIVFIIDTTGSMGDEISNVKNNVGYFVDALKTKGVSAGLALVEYRDIEEDGYDSTKVHKNGSSNWFYDMDAYKNKIASSLYASGGGDTPESAVDALETARLLDMRASAGKIFVLVTDANYKSGNRYSIPSMATEIELLKNAGVSCSVVSPSGYQSTYYSLYSDTNGIWANIYGNFYNELMTLADKIGDEIVGDGYWIYLQGPIPVPVRLDEMPYEGSTVDTDKDGIPDIEELESATPTGEINLDNLITKVSRGAITGTDYGIVKMYKYKSSPVEEDTDFDGIADSIDISPLSPISRGKMTGYPYDLKDAQYSLDYRKFLSGGKGYNKDLATTSLVFSNAIYADSSFSYYGTGKENRNIVELMQYHGFREIDNYKLAMEYDDDDISEICIGYHDINCGGKISRIIGIVVRGTNGTIEEWSSNFNIGDKSYWNSEYHKGFYTTEERIKKRVEKYINKYGTDNDVYWITGHSRGAAIANILASRLIDEGHKVIAYTFATPSTTTLSSANDSAYNSIINFVNKRDVIGYVPLEEWSFTRFGTTFVGDMDYSMQLKWKENTGKSSYNALESGLITSFTNRIYKSCCKNWNEVHNRAGKQIISNQQREGIPQRALRYCDLEYHYSLISDHQYELYPSLAFVFQLGAELLGDKKTIVEGGEVKVVKRTSEDTGDIVPLFIELWNSKFAGAIALFAGSHISDIKEIYNKIKEGYLDPMDLAGDGHTLATYYYLIK